MITITISSEQTHDGKHHLAGWLELQLKKAFAALPVTVNHNAVEALALNLVGPGSFGNPLHASDAADQARLMGEVTIDVLQLGVATAEPETEEVSDVQDAATERYGHEHLSHEINQLSEQIDALQPPSNFRKTAVTNIIASNLANATWEELDAQLDLIQSELDETRKDGVAARDLHELRDGVADMLVTVYGLGHRANLPVDEDYAIVDVANRSKFDTTMEDALLTQQKYADLGVTTKIHEGQNLETGGTHYVVKVEGDQGEKYPHGKYLKSYKWVEPVFAPLPEDHHLVLLNAQLDAAAWSENDDAVPALEHHQV